MPLESRATFSCKVIPDHTVKHSVDSCVLRHVRTSREDRGLCCIADDD